MVIDGDVVLSLEEVEPVPELVVWRLEVMLSVVPEEEKVSADTVVDDDTSDDRLSEVKVHGNDVVSVAVIVCVK